MEKIYLFVGLGLIFCSCNKNAKVETYIEDAPGDYASLQLEATGSSLRVNGEWIGTSYENPIVFDILDYSNGDKLFLSSDEYPAGQVTEMRFILTDNNVLTLEDGSQHNLKVPSGSSSGLKVKLQNSQDLESDQSYALVLDFDVAKSIVVKGNGTYSLKPVIRAYWESASGAIEGELQTSSQTNIYAINGADTIGSILTSGGDFVVGGLYPASYNLHFVQGGNTVHTIEGVSVSKEQTTDVGTIEI